MIAPSVPCAGSPTFDSVSVSPLSGSVQLSVIGTAVSTFVFFDTSEQLGARVTVIETVAVFELAVPSDAR